MKIPSCIKIGLTLAALTASISASAQAPQQPQGWMWGFGVSASQDVYAGFGNRIVPIPIIGYAGEKLRVYGPFVSYQMFQREGFTIDAQLVPVFAGYEESDSFIFEGMEDRDFSFAAGISATYNTQSWTYSLSTNADMLGKYDGFQATARIGKQFRVNGFLIEPSVGLSFQDSNYVDYYYGVRPEEATVLRGLYEGSSATNTELRVAVSTGKFLGGMTRVDVGATFFDSSISDSPLTDDDTALSATLIYSRMF